MLQQAQKRGDKVAIIWQGEPEEDEISNSIRDGQAVKAIELVQNVCLQSNNGNVRSEERRSDSRGRGDMWSSNIS